MNDTQRTWIKRSGIGITILAAFMAGMNFRGESSEPMEHALDQSTTWTCSMHPQIQLPEPGQCPICGMDLIPLVSSESSSDGPRSLTLSASAQKIAEIQTTRVERRAVERRLRMVGKLEADESRIREIAAWVPGRIDRLHIDFTGVYVRKGQALFDLYSPVLYSAQEELLQALKASDDLKRSSLETSRQSAGRTVHAAREKLRLLGLTAEQIRAMETRGTPLEHVTIVAPSSGTVLHKDAVEGSYVQTGTHVYSIADLSVLWLKLDVYESDIAFIALGQTVRFTTDSFFGEEFDGVVSFIDPVLDPRSRSIKVRVNVENSDGRLKPGMFARATVHAEVRSDDGGAPIVIPKTAPLFTGARAVVYVADSEVAGQFHGRTVVLGPEAGDFIVVREGLQIGEMVVSNGSFKIDSALQILAKSSMMNPDGGGPAPGHHHGDAAAPRTVPSQASSGAIAGVPQQFRMQLDEMLGLYFDLSTALSQDNLDAAKGIANKLPDAIQKPAHSLLPAAGHTPWGEAQSKLTASANAIASSSELSTARNAFEELSVHTIQTVKLFGASGDTAVLVFHCPMAMDGAGADWLQPKEGTENPYLGLQMPNCGSRTEVLVAGGSAETGSDDHRN